MSKFSRVLESTHAGALRFVLSGDLVSAKVIVEDIEFASVVLSTEDGVDSDSDKAIKEAKFSESAGEMTLALPKDESGGGVTITSRHGGSFRSVSIGGGGSSFISNASGDMVIHTGRNVIVNGVRVSGGNSGKMPKGIKAEIHLPRASTLKVDSEATFEVTGELLKAVKYSTQNGDLYLHAPCKTLEHDAKNGNLLATQLMEEADVTSHNGNVEIQRLAGNAMVINHNGNVSVTALASGKVTVHSHNGNVSVADPNRLGPDRLHIKVRNHNGHVRTPHSS